jgi:FixJ family two-component response regulator
MVIKMTAFQKPIVYLVDTDQVVLDTISKRLGNHPISVEIFLSAEEFLDSKFKIDSACLIVEVNLPEMDGIELLKHINNLGIRIPTIVLSSRGNVPEAVRAMQAKAIDFFEKPFIEDTLVTKILEVLKLV